MLYIDSLTVHNFKSFKYAKIKFGKGFSCIVGPNGSGKSCICDALLFALGETSLKRLRINTLSKLINDSAKLKADEESSIARVKVVFSGDETVEISKALKHGNKVSYRLNGKRVNRNDVIEALRHHYGEIDDTNTITQGEITKMLDLSAKERRELIDTAAGIKEFNEKKTAALKELEKVEQKINEALLVLNERTGFLKELESEKGEAERYLFLKESVNNLSYKILKKREKTLSVEYELAIGSMKDQEIRKRSIEASMSKTEEKTTLLFSEKEKILKEMNKGSSEISGINREMEDANKEIAVSESRTKGIEGNLVKVDERIKILEEETQKISKENDANAKRIDSISKEIEEKSKGIDTINWETEEKLNRFERLNAQIDQMNGSINQMYKDLTNSVSELESMSKNIVGLGDNITALSKERDTVNVGLELSKVSLYDIGKSLELTETALLKKTSEKEDIEKRVGTINTEIINTREYLAMQGGSDDRIANLLKKGIKSGFYGKAYELCSYEEKYAPAVNAASSSRMNYFVVDSSETANEAIKILKAQNAGRATFIPLEDMVQQRREPPNGLDPLIEHISFDKKVENAFLFIFSNTFVVSSINEAKKKGYGRYRFVTLEGELIDTSGAITGGSIKVIRSPLALRAKLAQLEADHAKISSSISEKLLEIDNLRKDIGKRQTEALNIEIETRHTKSRSDKIEIEIGQKEQQKKSLEAKRESLTLNVKRLQEKHDVLNREMITLKTSATKEYSEINTLISGNGKKAKALSKSTEAGAKARSQREEVEALKINLASLSKEREMLDSRNSSISNEITSNTKLREEYKKEISEIRKSVSKLVERRKDLQEKIRAHDDGSASLYKSISSMEAKISELAQEKGKMRAELERIERSIIELNGTKMQTEVRIADIKAELSSYAEIKDELIESGNDITENLEKELAKFKNEMDGIRTVNLKAPELYVVKRKEVDEATGKAEILKNESDSIRNMIAEIDTKKMRVFTETYDKVNENFKRLYGYIFEGSASLTLENQKDPFLSGLSFAIKSNNLTKAFDGMSGGEQSLVMLMLVFAIQQCASKSYYIFDEIDSALDKENSKKLSVLIRQMSQSAQFIVVSHNDALITSADTAIGVMKNSGESKVVGIQLTSERAN